MLSKGKVTTEEESRRDHEAWINREAAKLEAAGITMGSPREEGLLETWRRIRPEMCRRLGPLLPKLAFVLDMKSIQAAERYVKAGMPPSDASLEATREWLILEPDDPYGRVPDP